MVEETPSRMSVGAYRILNDEDEEMDLSPVLLRDENNITIDDDYSRRVLVGNQHLSTLQNIDDDSDYMHFTFSQQNTDMTGLNYLNIVTLMIHLFVSCGIGIWGLNGNMATHVQITQEYETLVTPAKWAYYIWIPILFFETVFGVAQCLPAFRSRPIIQDGTGYFFFYTSLLQTAYTLSFAFHIFIASFLLAVATFLSLAWLLVRQFYSQIQKSRVEYWLFRFPFFLHCGWMAVMVAVNASMLCRNETSSISTQLAIDMVALAVQLPLATFLLWFYAATDFLIPSIIIYSYVSRLMKDGVNVTGVECAALVCVHLWSPLALLTSLHSLLTCHRLPLRGDCDTRAKLY